MKQKVIKIVALIVGVPTESLNEESSPDTVAYWDSIKHMNLIQAVEEEFKVSFSDEEIMNIYNIKSILDLIKAKGVDNKAV
jgi:acyl carrier protein